MLGGPSGTLHRLIRRATLNWCMHTHATMYVWECTHVGFVRECVTAP